MSPAPTALLCLRTGLGLPPWDGGSPRPWAQQGWEWARPQRYLIPAPPHRLQLRLWHLCPECHGDFLWHRGLPLRTLWASSSPSPHRANQALVSLPSTLRLFPVAVSLSGHPMSLTLLCPLSFTQSPWQPAVQPLHPAPHTHRAFPGLPGPSQHTQHSLTSTHSHKGLWAPGTHPEGNFPSPHPSPLLPWPPKHRLHPVILSSFGRGCQDPTGTSLEAEAGWAGGLGMTPPPALPEQEPAQPQPQPSPVCGHGLQL